MATPVQLAVWRHELQQVYDTLMKGAGEQFEAWFEETAMLEAEIEGEGEDLRKIVEDIKKDRQRYTELIKQVPQVDEFSAEEVEQRSGKASQLLDIAGEVIVLEMNLPLKVEKLRFLLKHPSQ